MAKNKFSLLNKLNQNTKTILEIYEAIRTFFGPTNRSCFYCNIKSQVSLLASSSSILEAFTSSEKYSTTLIKLLAEGAAKTLKYTGGGATVTILLSCKLLLGALRFSAAKYNSIQISNGLNRILFFLKDQLLELSSPISEPTQLQNLVTTAAGKKMKEEIASLLCKASSYIKRDGILIVEETTMFGNKVELINGIELDAGFASPYFINDTKNFEVFYNNPYLLILESSLHTSAQLKDVVSLVEKENASLIIIAESISEKLLSTLILYSIKKKLKVAAIKYQQIKFLKTGILEDISLLTHRNVGAKIDQTKFLCFGQIKQAIIQKTKSTFIFSKFTKIIAQRKVNELNRELLFSETEYERSIIKARIARLSSNTIKIKIGNLTSYEGPKERQRAEGILQSVTGALEEGCVYGGGLIYLKLKEELKNWGYLNLVGEETYSIQIASDTLISPFLQIAKNLNIKNSSIIEQPMNLTFAKQFDLKKKGSYNECEDHLLDSAKQVRQSLWNSITLVAMILTCD